MPGGEQAARPILIGRLGDSSWRTLGDDCGGRPREWLDERRLIIERFARLNPFWSADGSLLYCTPTGTNPSVRSAIRGRAFDPETGLRAEEPIAVYSSNEMLMPAYLPGTTPIATPDQMILVLGDFRGDVWLMELGEVTPP
jgi:hypothetical protein